MVPELANILSSKGLMNAGTPLLLACSGGRDSMALLHWLLANDYKKVEVAHCNFQLRGKASDADEAFVAAFCREKKIPFHCIHFDTANFAQSRGISTQMAARILRYDWLETIRKERSLDLILTAHHANDQAETILYNLSQGTGIRGLTGMQQKNGCIIRPLLEVSRARIEEYIAANQIAFREDSSNEKIEYRRNFIRHEIMPGLEKLNPAIIAELSEFSHRMTDTALLMLDRIDQIRKKALEPWKNGYRLHIIYILQHRAALTILYELLKEFAVTPGMITELNAIFSGSKKVNASGQLLLTESHQLFIEKKSVYILPKESERTERMVYASIPSDISFNEYSITLKKAPLHKVNIKSSPDKAYFDADVLKAPIMIRCPQPGDYFYPFGLGKPGNAEKAGKKKLSKFFKDEKVPLPARESTPLIFAGDKLAWVVGHRTDDRFKVTARTKEVWVLTAKSK